MDNSDEADADGASELNRGEGGKFLAGTSGNPVGRPKGSKNKVTLLKLVAEEAVRERNYDKIQAVMDSIIEDALAGDKDMRKLVWQAHISKGSADDKTNAQERVVIQIGQIAPSKEPEKGITIDHEEIANEREESDES